QRAFERGERELIGPERALERMAPQPRDELRAAADDAGLRPAEQLVPREGDEARARGEALADEGFVGARHEAAGAEVVDQRQPEPGGELRELAEPGPFREPDDAEGGLVHPQD